MAEDNLTPEEKLLKIIENPLGPKKKPSGAKGKKPRAKKNQFQLSSLLSEDNIVKLFTLKIFNNLLIAASLLLTVYFIYDFNHRRNVLKNRLREIETGKESVSEEKKQDIFSQEAALDLEGRNLFTFFSLPEEKASEDKASAVELSEVVDNLKLVGVIWSEVNPQAMIENTNEQKTFILNVGDQLGKVKIKEIYRDRVLVEVEGKEWVLR